MTKRRENERKKAKEAVWRFVGRAATVFQAAASVVCVVLLCRADLLPASFAAVGAAILAALVVVCRLLMRRRNKKGRFFAGLILSALLSALLCAAGYDLYKLTDTLQTITDVKEETTRVGVYVLEDDPAETIQDAAGYEFGILETLAREDTDNAAAQIEEETGIGIAEKPYSGTAELADALLGRECGAIILNEGFVNLITDTEGYEDFDAKIKEIAFYEWKTIVAEEETEEPADGNGVFTMFISGIDTAGDISTKSRSDVNIIAVVNTDTRQVLLVSTPRDYFVPLSISGGVRDKLTHAGIYGVNVSMETLEMLYGTEIDYYFRINFSGFEELIDALGGVTVQSDYAFDVEPSFHYVKGSNDLNGVEALAFARERHAFAEGDRQRGKNQMAVITGVITKLQSPAVLQNFTGLMDGLEGSFESDIPYAMLSGLVKSQLSDGGSWNVVSYSVDGTGSRSSTYSMSRQAYVMVPDEATVEKAKELMEQVKAGETVSLEP